MATSPIKPKAILTERSSNLPSPMKSPSKIPLPPSPPRLNAEHNNKADLAAFAEQEGAMSQMFKASTLSQKPTLVRKIWEAHSAGQTYTSPSDDILSPASKKLSDVKGRRFETSKKSSSVYGTQMLFKGPKPAVSSLLDDRKP